MSTVGTLPEAKAKGKEEYRSVLYFASVAESQGKVPTVPTVPTYSPGTAGVPVSRGTPAEPLGGTRNTYYLTLPSI